MKTGTVLLNQFVTTKSVLSSISKSSNLTYKAKLHGIKFIRESKAIVVITENQELKVGVNLFILVDVKLSLNRLISLYVAPTGAVTVCEFIKPAVTKALVEKK